MSQKFSLVLHAIALISVFGVIIGMVNLNDKIDKLAQENAGGLVAANVIAPAAQNGNDNQVAPQIEPKPRAAAELEITDNGYSPAEIEIDGNKMTTITIKNSAQAIYSFVIDELNINIEAIAPGEEVGLVIAQEFAESESYTFRSNAEGDDPQTFTGVLMVIK